METVHRAAETIRKTSGSFHATVVCAATALAIQVSKSAASGPHPAPTLQNDNSKSAARNNRSPHLQFRALRQTPPPNTPAKCCQSHHASAPDPQKINDD